MELTAITFMYLYNLNIGPLDFMALKRPADHAFVVIGRRGSDEDDNYGRNWGKSAVVCDPWAYGMNRSFAWPSLRPEYLLAIPMPPTPQNFLNKT